MPPRPSPAASAPPPGAVHPPSRRRRPGAARARAARARTLRLGGGALAALALASGAGPAACTARPRARFEETRPPEVLVEVLPRTAEVRLDGHLLRRGPGLAAPPAGDASAAVTIQADGFVAEALPVEAGGLAGARIGVALRPEGYGGPPIDLEDAAALADAAGFLLAAGRAPDALDYAARAVALAPELARAHRVAGDARWALGDAGGAAAAWTAYLRLAPGAADAARVAERLEAARQEAARPAPGGARR